VLGAWASVTGVVVDEHGQPRAGVRVVASGAGSGFGAGMEDLLTGGGIKTDASGRFEVGRLAAGKGSLMIFGGESFMPTVTKPLDLIAGERLDLGAITVATEPTGDR
jgi:hypothetical protein